jgi:glycerol-3-phosphate dehydrogenase (NAD(P)+)
LAEKYDLELPICQAIDKVLHDDLSLDNAINNLLDRPLKQEI